MTMARSVYFERVYRGTGNLRAEYAASRPRVMADAEAWRNGDTAPSRVPVSLMGAYAALRLTRDPELAEAFNEEASQIGAMAGFINEARSGMTHTMLPFSRSAADIAYAAAMSRSCSDWAIRGEDTRVEGGYFHYLPNHRGPPIVRYVDRSGEGPLRSEVLLDPSHLETLLPRIEALPAPPARFVAVAPERHWIRLELSPPMRALLMEKPPGLRARSRGALSLVSRSAVVFLTELEIQEDDLGIALKELPVERVMALQAAAFDDQWLLLEHPEFCALGPFPDLFTPGSESPARVDPAHVFAEALGGKEVETLSLPTGLALNLMQRFHWMAAPHPVIWRALAEASE